MKNVRIIGAGLAGCEAAWQLAKRGIGVTLIEMKPECYSPAHHSPDFAELVCSNSLKAEHLTNASGLLKAEMEKLDSLVIKAAKQSRVPAGAALAVDRTVFSGLMTKAITENPLIEVERRVASEIPPSPVIIATGPLTHDELAKSIAAATGRESLRFFDAEAPIIAFDSIDMSVAFKASRYGKGDDYINCPMTMAEYDAFYDALVTAQVAQPHDFEKNLVFEGCLAAEILASRGRQTLAYGPMKPVGLVDPRTGKMPYAVVQLRQDDMAGTLYNMVGFQTRLKWGEQKRVFSLIPGLENARFERYGVMHRNTYIDSPEVLGENYAVKGDPLTRFAGQISGVEGYLESACSGIVAGIGMAMALMGKPEPDFGQKTITGALERYVRTKRASFEPMNANFGLLTPLPDKVRGKQNRYERLAERALLEIDDAIIRMEE